MNTTDELREAAQLALEALEDIFGKHKVDVGAINALRAALAEQPAEPEPKRDLMWSTVAMQKRHDERIGRIVNTLEQIKQEQAERYQPVRESFWWRVRIGSGTQTIGRCYTETEAQRLAAELQRAFNDGAFCVEKVVCNGDLIGAAPEAPQPAKRELTDEEIERLWYPSAAIAEPGSRRVAFGRAIIEAYERKNGKEAA